MTWLNNLFSGPAFTQSSHFSIFNILTLVGGLALFLYGMKIMSGGLESLAGGKLEGLLKKMTSNPIKSMALGAGITIAIQSSSALTVMLVGLVNSGIMQLPQTVGVIMGSNIGTTLTAWITSLAGIEGDNFLMNMLKPSSFSPIIAIVGILLMMASKKDKHRSIGSILIGFAILMFGMDFMSDSMKGLANVPEFTSVLTAFNNPILGVLVGTVFTGVIQSSAASVAVLQGLAATGSVSFAMAFPIIMGQNIGTTVTAAISAVGANKNARRVAVVHASFNVIGTAIFLIVYALLYYLVRPFLFTAQLNGLFGMQMNAFTIALSHTVFNVVTTLLLVPFSKLLVRIAHFFIKDTDKSSAKEAPVCFLDQRLFATPSVAVSECNARTAEMAKIAEEAMTHARAYLKNPGKVERELILAYEDKLDKYEDALGKYLVSLSSHALSEKDSKETAKLLHSIGNMERIGDHAVNMLKVADEIADKKLAFSPAAERELAVLDRATRDILSLTVDAFCRSDAVAAGKVEPLEQVIDHLIAEIRSRHIARLQKGNCTVEMGFILSDLLTNYERVSDHCSNLAVAVIEAKSRTDTAGAHAYLQEVKNSYDFNEVYEQYMAEYDLQQG